MTEMEPGRSGHGSPGCRVNILGRLGLGRVTSQCPMHMTRSFDPDSALQKCTFCLLPACLSLISPRQHLQSYTTL